jgi:hypothetical protein
MSGVLQLVSRLPNVNGLTSDVYENVLHLDVAGSDPAGQDIIDAMSGLRDFWIVDSGAPSGKIGEYLSEIVNRATNACSILAYFTNDYSGQTPMGSPIGQLSFTLPAAVATTQIPEEVCAVLSYHGDLTDVPVTQSNPNPPPATIRPAQRRRGRMFLGPLGISAGTEQNNQYRPNPVFRTDVTLAFQALYNYIVLQTPWVLGVWSKADAAVYPVVGGYMDDAWDVQRRRGLEPTTRTTFTIP